MTPSLEETLRDLTTLLSTDPDALALVVFGSVAGAAHDFWSDLDVLVVARVPGWERFFPSLDWLRALGEVYTCEQYSDEFTSVSRVCFADMRRLDVVLTTEAALEQIDRWPFIAFADPQRRHVAFSRSTVVDNTLSHPLPDSVPLLPSSAEFQTIADGFRYKGVLAVTKVMRDDRLIALHLALEMVQDCLVLGMLLRDRAEGTSHHRTGGLGNRIVEEFGSVDIPPTQHGILRLLEQCSHHFDRLAAQWEPSSRERFQPLLAFIAAARQALDATRPRES